MLDIGWTILKAFCGVFWLGSLFLFLFSFAIGNKRVKDAIVMLWELTENEVKVSFKKRSALPKAVLQSIYEDSDGNISFRKVLLLSVFFNALSFIAIVFIGMTTEREIKNGQMMVIMLGGASIFSLPIVIAFEILSYRISRRILSTSQTFMSFLWKAVLSIIGLYTIPTFTFMAILLAGTIGVWFIPVLGPFLAEVIPTPLTNMLPIAFIDLAIFIFIYRSCGRKIKKWQLFGLWSVWIGTISILCYMTYMPIDVNTFSTFNIDEYTPTVEKSINDAVPISHIGLNALQIVMGAAILQENIIAGLMLLFTGLSICTPFLLFLLVTNIFMNPKALQWQNETLARLDCVKPGTVRNIAGILNFISGAPIINDIKDIIHLSSSFTAGS